LEFTPYTLPLIVAAVIALGLAGFTLRYREIPGRVTFAILMFAVAVWSAGYALEISAVATETKIFWAKVQYFGIAVIPLLWLRFVVHYVGESAWMTTGRFALLAIGPLLTVTFVWFNESLELIWRLPIEVDESLGFPMLVFDYGPGLWAHAGYSYVLLLIGALVLLRAIVRLPRLGSRQGAVVLIAALAPWAGNALYLTGKNPWPLLDLTPFSFTVTGLAVAWGMGRFQFMGTVPVAHRAIIASMESGVVALDTADNIVEINPAAERMFDLRAADVVGKSIRRVFAGHPEVIDWLTTQRETTLRGTFVAGGVQREFDIRILLLYDRRRHAGRLITFHDISKLAVAEREAEAAKENAEAANRSKSEFLANVSHEIRTPLNAIIGMTDLSLEGELSDRQREHLEIVRSSAGSLLSIINDILDFSKIEVRKLELDRVDFDIRKVVRETVKMLAVTASGKPLKLVCMIAPDVPAVVVGDALRLRQVLSNLIANAIKFTSEGEVRVDVRLAEQDQGADAGGVRLHFAVSDTGIGISDEDKKLIFESFAQADASTTRIYGGTGLGLSIASHLIGLMGGAIDVESEIGTGSTFRFDIVVGGSDVSAESLAHPTGEPPAVAVANLAEVEIDAAQPGHVRATVADLSDVVGSPTRDRGAAVPEEDGGSRWRLLVAEDNLVNQRVASTLLESRGHEVKVVGDGQEAIEALGESEFDLVLMDIQMPRLDGIDATRSIRAGEQWTGKHVPIVAITAHAMAGDRERFLEAGMDAYVPKPLDARVLFETIGRLLGDGGSEPESQTPEEAPSEETLSEETPVIDRAAVLEKLGGDEELLAEIIELYLDDAPKVLDSIRAAFATEDVEGVWKAAHRLKGSVGSLSADPAFQAAKHLEEVGRKGDLAAAVQAFEALEREAERLAEELATSS